MLDIFNNDAFGVVRLTDVVNEIPFVPGRIGQLGLFGESSIDVTTVTIERKGQGIELVSPSARGGPGQTSKRQKGNIRILSVPHFQLDDGINADEVQGVRAHGEEMALETVAGKLTEVMNEKVISFSATEEYHRLGALSGIVKYADGTTTNLFTELGVAKPADVSFDLNNAGADDGALRKVCAGITRKIQDALGAIPFTGIHAFCGDDWFDKLLGKQEVRETYKGWNEAQILRDSYIGPNRPSWGIFEFGGIVFENYRGSVNGTNFIEPDEARIFPVGAPGMFRTAYAPADYVETVNTLGERLYAKQMERRNGKGVDIEVQHNALQYVTRPKALIKGTL